MPLEEDLIAQGIWPLCGVDEAGRGPLAGPVVAAAVIMDPRSPLRTLVRDSKRLSETQREKIFGMLISSNEVYLGISMVDASTIDEINILKSTLMAMAQAVGKLAICPACALVDGNVPPRLDCRCITVVKGDASEPSISAASIVAKVTRDRYMEKLDELYPGYGFSVHKGYPTKAHMEAIYRLGPSQIHRRSFRGVS
jgi:ribonuclease HII